MTCGLRDYGVEGQLGLEATPDLYVANMVAVFREVRRVLRDDGTVWLNMGDSYASNPPGNTVERDKRGHSDRFHEMGTAACEDRMTRKGSTIAGGLKPKDLCMIPARLALALQADGWYLRSDVIWCKAQSFSQETTTLGTQGGLGDEFADCAITETKGRSGSTMPESTIDRPTTSHEHLFLLTKSPRYYYDSEAVREQAKYGYSPTTRGKFADSVGGKHGSHTVKDGTGGTRHLRSVWAINPQPFSEAHFATFPMALVEPCIKAGTSEKGQCRLCR